ncbi:MAG: flagellar hook-basal body complex protein, partial [Synergistaceae bacterium]|nr:flagellar hook-basal body complex protein [Synergistaceae bacterium]
SAAWIDDKAGVAETYYYGQNTAATGTGVFANIYADGTTSGPAVTGRVIVDRAIDTTGSSPPLPTSLPTTPVTDASLLAGAKILDIGTSKIYELNSTKTAWTEIDPMEPETAYAVRQDSTGQSQNNVIYVLDSTNTPIPATEPMDISTGNKNIFTFTNGAWKSINDTQGTSTALSPSENSVTTQANIEAFGESIIASRDWEDKFTVYDSLGNPYTMNIAFRKVMDRPAEPTATPPVGAESEWDWYAYYTDSDGNVQTQYGQGAGTMVFGDDGLLKRTYYYEPTPATPNPNGTNTPTPPQYNWTVVEKVIGSSADESKATGKVVADFNTAGAQGSVSGSTYSSNMITLDFLGSDYAKTLGLTSDPIDGVTSYGSASTTKLKAQDGYEMGVLNDWTVGADGVIQGSYSNGKILPIAQVALAMFANPQGLSQVGETCFAETINSGIAQIGAPQTNGAGSIQGNTVEMSNVDLSEEFVNLIRAQRGFQASTRVVSTSDEVLQELINLKR